ncbi:MAG: HAD family hydrolase [Treponema sp.]|nr:HAD family hydrolase [Treponema sp.]
MKFDSVILDVDGTIWDTTDIVAQAWNCAIDKMFPVVSHVTGNILKGQFGKTMKTIADNLFVGLEQEEKARLMEECCRQEQLALKANTKNITYDGVVETIRELHSKGVPLFIVSNCQKGYIEVVIAKNQIAGYITDFECYGNNGFDKAQNIKLICERNDLHSPVYVGDTQGDADACSGAGVPFIWAAYGFGKAESYYQKIEKFEELKNVIHL